MLAFYIVSAADFSGLLFWSLFVVSDHFFPALVDRYYNIESYSLQAHLEEVTLLGCFRHCQNCQQWFFYVFFVSSGWEVAMQNLICLQYSTKLPVFVKSVSKPFFALPLKPKLCLTQTGLLCIWPMAMHTLVGLKAFSHLKKPAVFTMEMRTDSIKLLILGVSGGNDPYQNSRH